MFLKITRLLLFMIVPVLFSHCTEEIDDTVAEENLVIALEPDPGNTMAKAFGASYDFNVVVKSKMPPQGVNVSVVYKKELDNSVIFSQTVQASSSPFDITIPGIPFNEVGIVTVEVKSKSNPVNAATTTFRLVRK